jgi:hypothetical protein
VVVKTSSSRNKSFVILLSASREPRKRRSKWKRRTAPVPYHNEGNYMPPCFVIFCGVVACTFVNL